MYSLIWSLLPGPRWLRAILSLVLAVLVVAACFHWLFPWLATVMPFNNQTVDPSSSPTG